METNLGSSQGNSGAGSLIDPASMTVVKRNGMMVPFRKDRIVSAIDAAWRATHKTPQNEPLSHEDYKNVKDIADRVTEAACLEAAEGATLTVEGIQDLVEVKLMEAGQYEVARCFIIYRDEHKVIREDSPRNLKIIRRDGKQVRFMPIKIGAAIESAFRATRKIKGLTPQDVVDAVNLLSNRVVAQAVALVKQGGTLEVEWVQDQIEQQMMASGFFHEAKDFILYRAERAALRVGEYSQEEKAEPALARKPSGKTFTVRDADDKEFELAEEELRDRIAYACKGLENVSAEAVWTATQMNFYDGIRLDEIDTSNIMAARALVEKDPQYSLVAARLLLDQVYRETIGENARSSALEAKGREYFKTYLKKGVEIERLDEALLDFDLDFLGNALQFERDKEFNYLGMQTLYDRYLIHENERRLETPQIFWMRVAMGLSLEEGKLKNQRAVEFYEVLSQFHFVSSTPTLFNSGTVHSQMSSCYLSTVMDDLAHIFKIVSDDAQLSKWAGGLGNDWTNVRATGSWIKGTNGKSQGVIPFLKVANDTAVAVNQGGKRKGAMCAYLETWHLDIEDFLELRKNTGDERRRTHDMNTANWIPDLFMKRVQENGTWTLFSPSDVPDLHDLYGKAFEERYCEYEKQAAEGQIKLHRQIEAVQLWRKMLSMLFETGHPWLTFKDPSNIRSPQDHAGVVHSSNLCTEILLNTSRDETAVCNLGSVNLARHTSKDGLNEARLEKTIKTAIRMLDNVIDINFYPTVEAKNANLRHRPVGLGVMGFQDALYELGVSYASPEAVTFADRSMEMVSYYAILSSSQLAEERGTYSSYKGSKWDRGLLPIDTIQTLIDERGVEYVDVDSTVTLDWDRVRASIKKHGMRNSNTMAIAPTATIANITGVTQSIEPTYKHLFAKSNLSGEFIVVNTYLVEELARRGLWDEEMIDDLKYFDGSIHEIERIPEDLKQTFVTAFEIDAEWLIECASRRQKWIDMGQSLNLYIAEPSGKRLHEMYMSAWKKGLKTTYYLRSLGATQIEKSTTDVNRRGLQPRWMKSKSASSEIQVAREEQATAMPMETCNLDGDCESCQ